MKEKKEKCILNMCQKLNLMIVVLITSMLVSACGTKVKSESQTETIFTQIKESESENKHMMLKKQKKPNLIPK